MYNYVLIRIYIKTKFYLLVFELILKCKNKIIIFCITITIKTPNILNISMTKILLFSFSNKINTIASLRIFYLIC